MKATIKLAKTGDEYEFDSESLPAASNEYVWVYGLTQSINDAAASVVRKNFDNDGDFELEARTKAERRVEQIRTGDVPGTRVPASPTKKLMNTVQAKLRPGFDASKVDPEKLIAWLERQEASGRQA